MIELTIGSGIYCKNLPEEAMAKIEEDLTFDHPQYIQAKKMGSFIPASVDRYVFFWQSDEDDLYWITRGYIYYLTRWLKKKGYKYKVIDKTLKLPKLNLKFIGKLRDYQGEARDDILSYPIGVLEALTGAGKSATAIGIMVKRKQPTLVIVHTKELLYQWQGAIKKFTGYDCGLLGDGKKEVKDITVGIINTVKTMSKDLAERFGHIIIDECHKIPASTWGDTLQDFKAKYYLGLSATMYRRDGLGHAIFACIGPKKHKVDAEMLHETGSVLKPEIIRVDTPFYYLFKNDYSTMMSELCKDKKRNRVIVKEIAQNFKKYHKPILVVSDRKNHCELIRKGLLKLKINNAVLTGSTKPQERAQIVTDLKNGECKILIATLTLVSEGFDLPELTALFLTTPVKFSGKLIQVVGRILRPAKNKIPRVYDFRDNDVNVLRFSGFHRDRIYKKQWGSGR